MEDHVSDLCDDDTRRTTAELKKAQIGGGTDMHLSVGGTTTRGKAQMDSSQLTLSRRYPLLWA